MAFLISAEILPPLYKFCVKFIANSWGSLFSLIIVVLVLESTFEKPLLAVKSIDGKKLELTCLIFSLDALKKASWAFIFGLYLKALFIESEI